MISPGMKVVGHAANGEAVRFGLIKRVADDVLVVANAVETIDGFEALDFIRFVPATKVAELEVDHLVFDIFETSGQSTTRLGVVLATIDLFETVSGRSFDTAVGADGWYGRWLLP